MGLRTMEWTKNVCWCAECDLSWMGVTPDDPLLCLECPHCHKMTGALALDLYDRAKISIGKLRELLGMDIYEVRAFLKKRKQG